LNSIIADSAAANFTNNITADRTVSLDSARTITGLTFGDGNTATAGSWILDNNGNAANTLTGLTAITVNALGTGKTATISAVIAGSTSRIELNGAGGGTLVLAGANTFNFATNNANFGWRLNAGSTVVVASDSAFGVSTGTDFNASTLVNLNGGTLQASGSARTVANPIWLNGSTTVVSGSQSLTFSGAAMGRGNNATVTNNITGGGTLSFTGKVYTDQTTGSKILTFNGTGNTLISGVIANNTGNFAGQNGSIIKSGTGTLTLSNTASTYTGATQILASVMEVAALANGGTASSIGQSTNAAANLVFGAPTATMRYTGSSNATTDRGFTLSSETGGGATIESSGVGTLSFDNTVALAYGTTGQTRLLTLGGTNIGANTFSKVIADNGAGATSLTKAGAGQWVIGGTNTYTGTTNVSGGKLTIAASGTINNTSGVSIGAGEFNYNASTALSQPVSFSGTGGTLSGSGTITPAVDVTTGNTLAIGNSVGVMNFGGSLTVGGTCLFELDNTLNTADLGDVAGALTLGGILDLVQLGAYAAGDKFTLFAYDGTLTGLLKDFGGVTNILDDTNFTDAGGIWKMNYNDTTAGLNGGVSASNTYITITAIPEPNVAALLGGLGMLALVRRRR
jgi:fibronectin-binding autotransporter adhesin